jgi:hypothetical protein
MWRRAVAMMGTAMITTFLRPALAGVAPAGATEAGPSATGGSHLVVHDVFGLKTLKLQNFGFNAHLNGDQSADGWFEYRDVEDGTPFSAGGSVSCLTVIGEDAWIGASIEQSNDPAVVGLGAWWHVTDNGEGAGSPADITTFLGVGSLADTAAFCANHPAYRFPFAIDGGNILVSD